MLMCINCGKLFVRALRYALNSLIIFSLLLKDLLLVATRQRKSVALLSEEMTQINCPRKSYCNYALREI